MDINVKFSEEYLLCKEVITKHPAIRAKALASLHGSYAWEYLSKEFDTDLQKARALLENRSRWPLCSCGNKTKFWGSSFSATCSKACAATFGSTNRTAIQISKNEKDIADRIAQLITKGVRAAVEPKLITEVVSWTHECGHKFDRPLFSGGWLMHCPKCAKQYAASKSGQMRWDNWRKNNPDKKWKMSEETKARTKATNIEKYGVENVSQNKDVRAKISSTFRARYISETVPGLLKNILDNYDVSPVGDHEYFDSGTKHLWKHNTCGHEFSHYLNYGGMPSCPNCRPKSIPEEQMFSFVSSLVQAERGNRKLLGDSGREIDIFVPSKNLGIELNGAYWHSSKFNSMPILEKTNLAESVGISLLHFWDHEWISKQEVVKSIISAKLGFSEKIAARKCELLKIDASTAKDFLNEHHIHGSGNRLTVNFGLYHNKKLVMVTSFGKPRFTKRAEWEIIRSSSRSGTTVVGGFSKILKRFISDNTPKSIVTYADRRFFDGRSYLKMGFEKIATRQPNFWYIKGGKRLSRIEAQKHKLKSILVNFDPSLTEEQNMIAENWFKITDCGVSTWILHC